MDSRDLKDSKKSDESVKDSPPNPADLLNTQGESLESPSTEPQVISPETKVDDATDATSGGSDGPAMFTPSKGSDSASGSSKSSVKTEAAIGGTIGKAKVGRQGAFWERVNVYLLIFILLIVISLVAVAVIYIKNRSTSTSSNTTINQGKLSSEALQQLANNGVQVGDSKQVLNIQSNSVFAGTVLVKGELQVAGGLKIGSGSLALPDMNVSGTAIIHEVQTQALAVAGNAAIQGQLTVQQNLSVNGTGTFNGAITTPQLTAGKLQISGDLALTKHLIAGGAIPSRANGGALGGGGTSSVSGSDTSGSISINTGSGASAGCLLTVTFSQAFTATPHVVITPVGAPAGSIDYYINRSTSSFSVCSSNAPPSNQSFGFDYIVLG